MELDEIEYKISCGELNAAQVFTQMKQHIEKDINGNPTRGMYYCNQHGGHGFMSDCIDCAHPTKG